MNKLKNSLYKKNIIKELVVKIISFFMLFILIIPVNATYLNKPNYDILGSFTINNDSVETSSLEVTLNMDFTGVTQMRFGNTPEERDSSSWEPYSSSKSWTISGGKGNKTVYASFRNSKWEFFNTKDEIIYTGVSLPYTNGLTLWLDAKDESILNQNSSQINTWSDKSGNNYNAVQNTFSNQPSLLTNEVDFNGTNNYFSLEDINYQNSNPIDGLLVCGVFKTNHVSSHFTDNWAILDFDRSEWFSFYNRGGDYGFSYDSNGTIRDVFTSGAGINDNSWHTACASYDNSVVNDTLISINGNTEYVGNLEPNGAQIGVSQSRRYGFVGDGSEASSENGNRNGRYYDGGIGELIYFDSAVDFSNRKQIECYLGEKWGIETNGCSSNDPNPIVSIEYSPKNITSGSVTANLINESENITITNNGGSDTYVFTDNGSFTFEFIDSQGNLGSSTATVDWINLNGLPSIPDGTENISPIITSFSGAETVDLTSSPGATNLTKISAIDNDYNVVGEFGKKTLSGNSWSDIGHSEMCSPIVTVSHRGKVNGEIQRAPRVRNKSGLGFQVKVDNYNSTIGAINTDIDYVVLNSGTHNFSGLQVQAGSNSVSSVACKLNNNPGTASSVLFSPNFSNPPSVLHTVTSENDSSWVVSGVNANDGLRQNEPTISNMGIVMQRSFNSCVHGSENIDYMAFEPGHYTTDLGFEIDSVRSTDSIASVTSTGYPINYFSPFSSSPGVALVSQLGEDGGNGSYGQIHTGGGVLKDKLYATPDEDGPGADRSHTTEIFSSVAFSSNEGKFIEENELTYSIDSGLDSAHFTIDSNSGDLSFITGKDPANPTDSDGNGIYEVIVSACDSHCNSKCDYQKFNVNVRDSIPPTVSGSNFGNNDLLPGGNHDFEFYYSDDAIGIDTNSVNLSLQKWGGNSWGTDISGNSFGNGTITTSKATYSSLDLEYGKYKINFNISDNNGNTSSNFEYIFYIDKPDFRVSDGSFDIGELSHTLNNFTGDVVITVRTVGVPFRVMLKRNQTLTDSDFIPYYDGNIGFGYDKNQDGNLHSFDNEIIGEESLNINLDGELNTYTYTVNIGAIIEEMQTSGNYKGYIDFGIELDY